MPARRVQFGISKKRGVMKVAGADGKPYVIDDHKFSVDPDRLTFTIETDTRDTATLAVNRRQSPEQ